jgi:superfamily I DNA and/or RNA helicase
MLDIFQNIVLIDGINRTSEIEKINYCHPGRYNIKFHKAQKTYTYGTDRVIPLKEPENVNIQNDRIIIRGLQSKDLCNIVRFNYHEHVYWSVKYNNGYSHSLTDGEVEIRHSCIAEKKSKDTFEYLKQITSTNILGKDDDDYGLLFNLYDNIKFIDDQTAIAPYLNPKTGIKHSNAESLIYPFGLNESQKKAVENTFSNQISVIKGPPGTGKTQTILNIIANIILRGKTVLVVSNNNSATKNVLDKLAKYNMEFIVAPLGKKENKEAFLKNQPPYPDNISTWGCHLNEITNKEKEIQSVISRLDEIFVLQEELALYKQELQSVDLEWKHFMLEQNITSNETDKNNSRLTSSRIMQLWIQFQTHLENDTISRKKKLNKLIELIKWRWTFLINKYLFRLPLDYNSKNPQSAITQLQSLYYKKRISELNEKIKSLNLNLKKENAQQLSHRLESLSMDILKNFLNKKYGQSKRKIYTSIGDLRTDYEGVLNQYPVVLSTTFSSRICLSDKAIFDYLIMDEASQVSVETGALAMSIAKNAVIVGDTLQLPNIVTNEDKIRIADIGRQYNIPKGYDPANKSFLESVCEIIPDIKETLLREHYRCHPKIINFCNQKFYGGNLLIMTEDKGEPDTICAFRTAVGNHSRDHYNKREIDVIKEEVLPTLHNSTDLGIIAPYNNQVNQLNKQLPEIECSTVHKFQGREKDHMIMSAVDDQITAFSDDPNLLNVAISRAKKKFCIVVTGNEQNQKGNISELISYIEYNNFTVTSSKVRSIFDYLYSQYTIQRQAFIEKYSKISEYDSENLTFALIQRILRSDKRFSHFGVLCHIPLRNVIKETSLLEEDELRYAANYNTHLDFLIINHVNKIPVLVIETDGYTFHSENTEQHQRDLKKDHILQLYRIPLLRLSTTGSGEKEKIIDALTNQK